MTTAIRPRPATAKMPDHGTLSRRKWHGCKCEPCLQAGRDYENRRHRLMGYGTWGGLVDAEPVRQHIGSLRAAGGTINVICRAANVSTSTLANIMYPCGDQPPSPTTRADTAAKILALTPEDINPAPATVIDGTGTRRRIQALVAIGWPLTHLGPQVGLHPRHLTEILRRERVTADTAAAVRKNYRRLISADPLDRGIPRHGVTLAKNLAAGRGWPPPIAWGDDIDNPAAVPDLDNPADPFISRDELAEQRREEVWLLRAASVPEDQIAARVGVTTNTVRVIATELRTGKKRDRTKAVAS